MMSVVHTFKLYELINKYFRNDEDSKAFVSEVDNFVKDQLHSDSNGLATKADIGRLESRITGIETEVSKLEIKMGEGFRDVLKWIIVLMVAFASLIITCIKFIS